LILLLVHADFLDPTRRLPPAARTPGQSGGKTLRSICKVAYGGAEFRGVGRIEVQVGDRTQVVVGAAQWSGAERVESGWARRAGGPEPVGDKQMQCRRAGTAEPWANADPRRAAGAGDAARGGRGGTAMEGRFGWTATAP
jgi:hypothetical protein